MINDKQSVRILSILKQAEPLLLNAHKESEIKVINGLLEKVNSNEVSVLICGEFKRGKSSFINALLGESICPVDVGIATSVVSFIKYGARKKIVRYFGDIKKLQEEEILFDDIEKYAKGSSIEIDNTVMLLIEFPLQILKNGLVLIDTPGVGGLDPRHLFLTLYALPKADIVLFMLDAGEPMTSTELNFYKEKIVPYSKQNAIIINKSDLKDENVIKQLLIDTKNKIDEHCNIPTDSLHIIPVSAEHWKMFNESKSERMRQSSNCDEIISLISQIVPNYKQKLLIEAKDTLISLLNNLLEPLEYQLSQIIEPNEDEQKIFQAKLTELQKIKSDLNAPQSELRKKINVIIKKSQADVISELTKQTILFSTECLDTILKRKEAQGTNGGEWVLKQINFGLEALAVEVDLKIEAGFNRVNELMGGLIEISEGGFFNQVNIDLTPEQKTITDKACALAKQTLPGMGILGLTGWVLSGVFTGGATWIAGLGALAAAGGYVYKNNKDSNVHTRIMELKTKLSPQITIVMSDLKQYVQQRFDEFNDALITEIENTTVSIVEDMQNIVQMLKVLENDKKATIEKKKQLNEQINFVNTLIRQSQLLMSNPFIK